MVYSRLVGLSYHTKTSQRRQKRCLIILYNLNQGLIHNELKDLVPNSVEETLNDLFDHEAEALTNIVAGSLPATKRQKLNL